MKHRNFLIVIAFSVLAASCGFVPVNTQFERAATLGKGNVELMGGFTANNVSGGGDGENINNNFGFRAGYGVYDKFDLKLRYERLTPSGKDLDFKGADYISIVPKFELIPEKFSLLVPVSHYSYKYSYWDDKGEKEQLFSIAPQILYTFTNPRKTSDLSLGVKADYLFHGNGEGGGLLLGMNVGAGFSSNLNKWAIRPELGAVFLGGGSFLSYGLGLQYFFPKKSQERTGL
jgi:hypothetical protein